MATPISINPDELERALAILDRWGSGNSGLPDASEFGTQGTAVGVTAQFHSHLTASSQIFAKLAADIRTAMATAHTNVTDTVVELSNTDASAATASSRLTAAVAPIASTIEGSGAQPTAASTVSAAPAPQTTAASGSVASSTDF